jgi:hypothetical protein
MLKRLAAVLFGMALFLPLSMAQMRGHSTSLPFVRGPVPFALQGQRSLGFRGRPRHLSSGVWGSPVWYADYSPVSLASEPAEPEVVVVQSQPAAPAPEAKLPEPLLIELQGGHYVRLRAGQAPQEEFPADADYAKAAPPKSPAKRSALHEAKPAPLAPVELIYRDGHHADVHDYTIMDGTIYARGDYWTDGYWEKKIQISALNVPATIKTNQQHGVKFVLPTSPNEVVTRP